MAAGYSGTPLAKKLGIKEGMLVLVVNAPTDYAELVAPLPDGVEIIGLPDSPPWPASRPPQRLDLVHLFTNSKVELMQELSETMRHIKKDGAIWVSWYKKAAKLPTEITEDDIRTAAFPLGLVDVKVCAVDEKWSGLKVVIRKENRN
ncbi:MAG TPA: DUF3052 family protein [Pyrinomonadaceae bacterium]|nr:DUF3052 family protein [Pyrinomonadaceae bacterium]